MKMHKNPFWLLLLAVVGLAGLWYTGKAAVKAYRFHSVSEAATVKTLYWEIEARYDDEYFVIAHYKFTTPTGEKSGKTSIEKFWNPAAAGEAISDYDEKKWTVWYNPDNPDDSTLQKKFPLKECLSAGILWGILLYFFWLGNYVTRYQA